MANLERSTGAMVCALMAVGLLGLSLAIPWFTYDSSSGRRTPPTGFHDPEDTQAIEHHIEFWPTKTEGDIEPSDPQKADQYVQWMGWGVFGAGGLLVLLALLEIPGLPKLLPRAVSLLGFLVALGAIAAPLAVTWYRLPETLAGYGVDGPFSYHLDGENYHQTTIWWGWVCAALAWPLAFGGALLKFQAGADDPSLLLSAKKAA